MESTRKRRGYLKGKLAPLYRAAKPSSNVQYSSSKVIKPSHCSPSVASVGFVVHHQDYVIAQPKPKIPFILPDDNSRDKVSQIENLYSVAGDEHVDVKAARYISSVQERFKLERVNSERTKLQDSMH